MSKQIYWAVATKSGKQKFYHSIHRERIGADLIVMKLNSFQENKKFLVQRVILVPKGKWTDIYVHSYKRKTIKSR